MGAKSLGTIIDVGLDILTTLRDAATNTILARIGDVVLSQVDGDNAEWWQHVGFASRPSKPTAGKRAAQAMIFRHSQRDVAFASRDVRGQDIYGELEPGETCIFAGGDDGTAQGRILMKANGSVVIYTAKGNAVGGSSVTIQANADGSIMLGSEYGAITIDSNGIKIATTVGTGSGIQLDGGGISMIGQAIAVNGAAVSIGANATLPAVVGVVGIAGVGSTSVKIAM